MSANKSVQLQIYPIEPWAKQSNEGDLEYEMFKTFRDTEPLERPATLALIAAKFGNADHDVKIVAHDHGWLSRAAKWDIWSDAAERQGALAKRRKIGSEMVTMASKMMAKAERAMNKLEELEENPTYREAIEMARLGIELEKAGFAALGMRDDTVTAEVSNGSPQEYVEQAMEIHAIIKRKTINVKPEDITKEIEDGEESSTIDGEFSEAD